MSGAGAQAARRKTVWKWRMDIIMMLLSCIGRRDFQEMAAS
jgi:hypothetical protein